MSTKFPEFYPYFGQLTAYWTPGALGEGSWSNSRHFGSPPKFRCQPNFQNFTHNLVNKQLFGLLVHLVKAPGAIQGILVHPLSSGVNLISRNLRMLLLMNSLLD